MSKISIIIAREYLSRVRKKTFLLTTLVLPIVLFGASIGIGYIANSSSKTTQFAVIDESGLFKDRLAADTAHAKYKIFELKDLDSLKINYSAKDFDALLHIKKFENNVPDTSTFNLYNNNNLGMEASSRLSDKINTIYQNKILADGGISIKAMDSINNLSIAIKDINSNGKENGIGSDGASAIGLASGFLIYLSIFIYGTMVMRGVMEEKTNRIAEIIVSSVKPFELMMGKVIGIGLVGLTQFLIWIIFSSILSFVALSFGLHAHNSVAEISTAMQHQDPNIAAAFIAKFKAMNIGFILMSFVFYFLGGYLLYASLFAAVGSMVNEDAQEAQSLVMPVTMPIILGFVIAMQAARDPNSGLAVFGSIFPLTSPLVMMARIGYHVPAWQIALSMGLLILTFIGTVFMAGKIYRTGILMYGKKLSWKEALKWLWKK
jgi:ABC-2 type transport system permease protein